MDICIVLMSSIILYDYFVIPPLRLTPWFAWRLRENASEACFRNFNPTDILKLDFELIVGRKRDFVLMIRYDLWKIRKTK